MMLDMVASSTCRVIEMLVPLMVTVAASGVGVGSSTSSVSSVSVMSTWSHTLCSPGGDGGEIEGGQRLAA